MTIQGKMKALLEKLPIPSKEISVYGSQIVITSFSRDAAEKWAITLSEFSMVRAVVESRDDAKENKNTTLLPSTVKVWRTFATI